MAKSVAEILTETLESEIRSVMKREVDEVRRRERLYMENLGARKVLLSLLEAGALNDSVAGFVELWVQGGGNNVLEIAGVRIFPAKEV